MKIMLLLFMLHSGHKEFWEIYIYIFPRVPHIHIIDSGNLEDSWYLALGCYTCHSQGRGVKWKISLRPFGGGK